MLYFDNASTTRPYNEVIDVVSNINSENYYNPSAIYLHGTNMNKQINHCRSALINSMHGDAIADYFVFTSSATESNHLAILGSAKKNKTILLSNAEHPSIYNLAKNLESSGYSVLYIDVDFNGKIILEDLIDKLDNNDVSIVSIIHVSNETGVINDLKEISNIIKSRDNKIIFHSDGAQAYGKIDVNVKNLGVDLYTISGHKIHATKGIGGIYIKHGINLKPQLHGGMQENNLRAGTENVSGIFALKTASDIIIRNMQKNYDHALNLRSVLIDSLNKNGVSFSHASPNCSIPHITMIMIDDIKPETIIYMLQEKDVYISNGATCSSKNSTNRVLISMGYDKLKASSSIRISFSEFNTAVEVEKFAVVLAETIKEYKIRVNKG